MLAGELSVALASPATVSRPEGWDRGNQGPCGHPNPHKAGRKKGKKVVRNGGKGRFSSHRKNPDGEGEIP